MGLQAQLNLTVINSVAAKSQKKMMEEGFATDLQPCSIFVVFVVFYRRQLLCNTFGGFQEFIQELHESAAVI
jgi:hypothetical protein